jgi:hypothetical protein
MSDIWYKMENCAEQIKEKMLAAGQLYNDPSLEKYSWKNHLYLSSVYRRGHVEVVDQRDQYGLFIVHATIFPNINSDAPIWGFDAVCGKNKITGAFHDFSLVSDEGHPMYQWFKARTENISWKKERTLPEWAQRIFSPSMVAAGNVQDLHEVDQFIELGLETLDYYIKHLDLYKNLDKNYTIAQNNYCYYQKQNPHVVRSMTAMGYDQSTIEQFVQEVLFPELGK